MALYSRVWWPREAWYYSIFGNGDRCLVDTNQHDTEIWGCWTNVYIVCLCTCTLFIYAYIEDDRKMQIYQNIHTVCIMCRNWPTCSPEHSWRLSGLVSQIIEWVSRDEESTWDEGIRRNLTLDKRKGRTCTKGMLFIKMLEQWNIVLKYCTCTYVVDNHSVSFIRRIIIDLGNRS